MAFQWNSIRHLRIINTYFSQTVPKNRNGRKIPKLIIQGQHYLDSESRQRSDLKELQADISDEHGCKKFLEDIRKLNPTVH